MMAFQPDPANTKNINVAASSASVQVGSANGGTMQVRMFNNGTATVWVNYGGSGVTATTSHMPVGANQFTEVMTIPSGSYIAAIAAGATGIIYFTPGIGI